MRTPETRTPETKTPNTKKLDPWAVTRLRTTAHLVDHGVPGLRKVPGTTNHSGASSVRETPTVRHDAWAKDATIGDEGSRGDEVEDSKCRLPRQDSSKSNESTSTKDAVDARSNEAAANVGRVIGNRALSSRATSSRATSGRAIRSRGISTRGISSGADGPRAVDHRLDALVRAAQVGNDEAFGRLWLRYAASVQTILLTMVNQQEAEDLAQETAVLALDALPRLANPQSFPAWLHTIARNLGRDAIANRRRAAKWSTIEAESIAAPPVGDSTAAEEILDAIRNLPESHHEPIMLRLVLEMTGAEIAEHTGMTEGSVRVNLCRGMKLLRARLTGQAEDGHD